MTDQATDEIWLPVVGFEDYEVSSLGRVRRSIPGKRNHACRVIRPWLGNHRYETVGLVRDGKTYRRLVHRLVCEAFHGAPPTPEHQVAHGDGTRSNNKFDNLRWATRSENMADCVLHGTKAVGLKHGRYVCPEKTPRGEKHGHAKLTEQDVIEIRANRGIGRRLAEKYGVSPALISLIRSRSIWTHLP